MRIIDCYYIKGYGKESKCYKIHGVGIGYNICKATVYGEGIGIASTILSTSPIVVCLGLGVAQGFVKSAVQFATKGVI